MRLAVPFQDSSDPQLTAAQCIKVFAVTCEKCIPYRLFEIGKLPNIHVHVISYGLDKISILFVIVYLCRKSVMFRFELESDIPESM